MRGMLERTDSNKYNGTINSKKLWKIISQPQSKISEDFEQTKQKVQQREKQKFKNTLHQYLENVKKSLSSRENQEHNRSHSEDNTDKNLENIEQKLRDTFDKERDNQHSIQGSDNSTSQVLHPRLRGRPVYVQQSALHIEQEVRNMIEHSDKDPNPIARILWKIIKKII